MLSAGQVAALEGQVGDELDAPGDLLIEWASDVDGLIATDPAGASGLAEAEWAYAGRSPGEHLLSLTATDACGNVASAEVSVCQQAGYTSDELDIASWHVEGVAFWDEAEDRVQLTGPDLDVVGTAFAIDQEVSGSSVSIRFNFYIGGGTGADGISLTALDTQRMSTFLGGTGCGIGYGGDADCTDGPALPGWSIEVDTYFNDGQDPTTDDHLMFTFDGDVDDPAAWAALPEMEDTGWHTLEVVVEDPWVSVSIDEVVYIDQELTGYFDFPAYVGFTAGTGGATNYHWIESLEVTDFVCGG